MAEVADGSRCGGDRFRVVGVQVCERDRCGAHEGAVACGLAKLIVDTAGVDTGLPGGGFLE